MLLALLESIEFSFTVEPGSRGGQVVRRQLLCRQPNAGCFSPVLSGREGKRGGVRRRGEKTSCGFVWLAPCTADAALMLQGEKKEH